MHSILSMDTPILVPENCQGVNEFFKNDVLPAPEAPPSRIFKIYFAGMFLPLCYHDFINA
ncbi:MAG: hypothetical protein ACTSYC_07230 [Promethearchaeota archaeon]